jgi:hypothetical protein
MVVMTYSNDDYLSVMRSIEQKEIRTRNNQSIEVVFSDLVSTQFSDDTTISHWIVDLTVIIQIYILNRVDIDTLSNTVPCYVHSMDKTLYIGVRETSDLISE